MVKGGLRELMILQELLKSRTSTTKLARIANPNGFRAMRVPRILPPLASCIRTLVTAPGPAVPTEWVARLRWNEYRKRVVLLPSQTTQSCVNPATPLLRSIACISLIVTGLVACLAPWHLHQVLPGNWEKKPINLNTNTDSTDWSCRLLDKFTTFKTGQDRSATEKHDTKPSLRLDRQKEDQPICMANSLKAKARSPGILEIMLMEPMEILFQRTRFFGPN